MKALKEEKVRPKKIFDSYLNLSKADTNLFFRSKKKKYFKCPACSKNGKKFFKTNF